MLSAAEKDVTINGERRSIASEATLLDVVRGLGLEPERVAIELDREIVKRDRWNSAGIRPGAEIEIVQFVGGG